MGSIPLVHETLESARLCTKHLVLNEIDSTELLL